MENADDVGTVTLQKVQKINNKVYEEVQKSELINSDNENVGEDYISDEEFKKMNYTEVFKLAQDRPEAYKSLMQRKLGY